MPLSPHLSYRFFTSRLKGEEVFGLVKRNMVCYLWVDDNSHRSNHVNFSYPCVAIPTIQPNIIDHMHIYWPLAGSRTMYPIVFQGGIYEGYKYSMWGWPMAY